MMTNRDHIVRVLLVIIVAIAASVTSMAQLVNTGNIDEVQIPPDTFHVEHEYWIGGYASALLMMNFGDLTVSYRGSMVPGASPESVKTTGGFGYGAALGAVFSYLPRRELYGLSFMAGLDYRWTKSESAVPEHDGINTFNATFETNAKILYLSASLNGLYRVGSRGAYLTIGATVDMPMSGNEIILWQHEQSTGTAPGETPGAPNTSIKYRTTTDFRPRVGLQIGAGHDFLAGLFGYRRQLVTPYVSIQAATPMVSTPTAWNSIAVRLGLMWRTGF